MRSRPRLRAGIRIVPPRTGSPCATGAWAFLLSRPSSATGRRKPGPRPGEAPPPMKPRLEMRSARLHDSSPAAGNMSCWSASFAAGHCRAQPMPVSAEMQRLTASTARLLAARHEEQALSRPSCATIGERSCVMQLKQDRTVPERVSEACALAWARSTALLFTPRPRPTAVPPFSARTSRVGRLCSIKGVALRLAWRHS
jgi:hypothetical protein